MFQRPHCESELDHFEFLWDTVADIRGVQKEQNLRFLKQGSAEAAYTQNPTSETRKFDFEPSQAAPSPIL